VPAVESPPLIRVAVVDDHDAVRLGPRAALQATPDLEPVGSAASAAEAAPLLYRVRRAPRVVLFSAFADASMTVPAMVAGVDAIVDKGAPTRELFDAIRRAARGQASLPEISPALLEAAGLQIERSELERRIAGMLERLTPNRALQA
jgi:DNA-binding NarL/FixJ family response regulator